MVRTRNNRSSSGGGGHSRDSQTSFKPLTSSSKKGRKRQLTDTEHTDHDTSDVAMLIPSGSSAPTLPLSLISAGTSSAAVEHIPEQLEQHLTPGNSFHNNFHNINHQDIQVEMLI